MSSAGPSVSNATVEVGRVFASGGIDGLILFAVILAVFLPLGALIIVVWINHRDRRADRESCSKQAHDFAEASREAADALKDVATALAAAASADMTFKQSIATTVRAVEIALERLNGR